MANKKPTNKPSGRGGVRPGAGRPSKGEAYGTPVKDAERRICDKLPELIDDLFELAKGGREIVEEKFERAKTVDEDGNVRTEMVLTERKVHRADMDRAAIVYLIDRVMGKPTQPIGGDDSAAPMKIVVEYTDPEPTE